ncbi:hypothetical protein ACO0QE_004529 [Hanseniaspora vineae]
MATQKPVNLPGFYFDPDKKRYFKIALSSADAPPAQIFQKEESEQEKYSRFQKLCQKNESRCINVLQITHNQSILETFLKHRKFVMKAETFSKIHMVDRHGQIISFDVILNTFQEYQFFLFDLKNGSVWKLEENEDWGFSKWELSQLEVYPNLVNCKQICTLGTEALFMTQQNETFCVDEHGDLFKHNDEFCGVIGVGRFEALYLRSKNRIGIRKFAYPEPFEDHQTIDLKNNSDVVSIGAGLNNMYVGLRDGTIMHYRYDKKRRCASESLSSWNIHDDVQKANEVLYINKIDCAYLEPEAKVLVFTNKGILLYAQRENAQFLGFYNDLLGETLKLSSIIPQHQILYTFYTYRQTKYMIYGRSNTPLKHFQVYMLIPEFMNDTPYKSNLAFRECFQQPFTDLWTLIKISNQKQGGDERLEGEEQEDEDLDDENRHEEQQQEKELEKDSLVLGMLESTFELALFLSYKGYVRCVHLRLQDDETTIMSTS